MSLSRSLPYLIAGLLAACGGTTSGGTVVTAAGAKPMDAAIAELMARPEHDAESVEVQHVLIAFQGAARATVTRTKEEAKALAERVFDEASGGADFTALMKQHSTDPGPGIYPMTKASRRGMVKGFGDVGWRLQPGEIGVAPYDDKASPFGWHVIKRLK